MPGDSEPSEGSDWATYEPTRGATESPESLEESPRVPPYRPPVTAGPSAGLLISAFLAILVIGAGAVAVRTFVAGSSTSTSSATAGSDEVVEDPARDQEPSPPDVLSPDGFADLVAAVEASTGTTVVFRAVLYPEYASVDVPVDPTSKRQMSLSWNGELSDSDRLGTSSYERVDLADLDAEVFDGLLRKARKRVDEPTSTYVIIEGASSGRELDARILAYASNEYSEGAYVAATLDGTVTRVVSF